MSVVNILVNEKKNKIDDFFYFSDARGTLYKTYQEYWSFDLRRSVIMHRLGNRLFAKSTLENKTELYFARSDYGYFDNEYWISPATLFLSSQRVIREDKDIHVKNLPESLQVFSYDI